MPRRTTTKGQAGIIAVSVMLILVSARTARAQSAVDGFNPGANGVVTGLAVQTDGKIVVVGDFTTLGGGGTGTTARNRIGRLNVDGSLDAGFNPGANGIVNGLAVQADGKILVAGDFTTLGGGGTGTTARNRIGRLNSDGSLDTSFDPGANAIVYALVVQSGGAILVGGDFTTLGGGSTGTTARNRIGRLNTDGSLDTGFNPGADSTVYALALQADGKVLVGGNFSRLGGGGGVGTPLRSYIGRVNADGSLDTGFDPGASLPVHTIAVQADGKSIVGGEFNTLGGGGSGTTPKARIGRLNVDGTLDTSFTTDATLQVRVVAVQPDGKVLVGGFFLSVVGGTISRARIARINADGSLDTLFDPGADFSVEALTVQPDGEILVGGFFTTLGGGNLGTTTRNHIGRLYPDGSLDTDFDPGSNDIVYAVAVQPDAKLVVGGAFATLGGGGTGTTPRNRIGRINADGSLDSGFNPGANGLVLGIAMQADGRIVVGGGFTTLGGGGPGTTVRNYLGRLNADGSLDTAFNPGANAFMNPVVIQADGKILIGGGFTTLGGGGTGTTVRNYLGRLNADGSLDASFDPGANGFVRSMAVQADGKILVGGEFTRLGGGGTGVTIRNHLGRLNADGSIDSSFDPGANFDIDNIAVQADGKIVVGGNFTTLGGGGFGASTRNFVGRLNADGSLDTAFNPGSNGSPRALAVQADGKILVGGLQTSLGGGGFGTTTRNHIGRLNADGSLDATFDPGANNDIYAMTEQTDGKIVVGGSFTLIGGGGAGTTSRSRIARLTNTGAAFQSLTVTGRGSVVNWARSGTGPDVTRVTFESSTDAASFTALGSGTRVTGGWQLGAQVTGPVSGSSATFPAFAGITVVAGQRLTITASGTICIDSPGCATNAPPNGSANGNGDSTARLPGAPIHSLICGINGQATSDLFFVGSSFSGTPSVSGQLFCGVNEQPGAQTSYPDNVGAWTMTVAVGSLPVNQNLYIRARGDSAGGYVNGAGSIVESIRNVWISPASQLAVTFINGGINPTAGGAFSVVVQAQDALGNAATVGVATNVSLALTSGTGVLGGTLTGTMVSGASSVTISAVTYTKAESGVRITATRTSGDSLTAGTSAAFAVNAGGPSQLAFSASPANTVATVAINSGTGGVKVEVRDAAGSVVTTDTRTVTLSIAANPGGGTLGGATTVAAVAGVATFTTLSIDKIGTGYTLTASSSPPLTGATSAAFNIAVGPVAKLAVTSINAGNNPVAGTAFQVVVGSQDAGGNVANVTTGTGVTLTRAAGTGTLGGTLTATIAGGTSTGTFSAVTYTKAENGVTMTATGTSGNALTAGTSAPFTVNPGSPNRLAIASVNSGRNPGVGAPFSVVVRAIDANGNPANVIAATSAAFSRGAGTGTLGGTTGGTIAAGTNSVTVSGVTYSKGETGVTMTATQTSGDPLSAGTSAVFNVNALAVPLTDLIQNGSFSAALAPSGWQVFEEPDIVSSVAGGVFQFYKANPTTTASGQAAVLQETNQALPARAPLAAQFDLGNSSAVRKRVSVLLVDSDFSDLAVCTFWLPASAQLRTYQMHTHTTQEWANASIYFYAADGGANGGNYLLDNVSLKYVVGQQITWTDCVDPMAPAASNGTDSAANLIVNGSFSTGSLAPWSAVGNITSQISSGVLEMKRTTSAQPAGVVLQNTGQTMPSNQVLTATFQLGNSSAVRKRVTVLLHDSDFSDLSACTFWIPPGQALSTYAMRGFTTKAWANATLSIYPATVGAEQWTQVDNVTLRMTGNTPIEGTECLEPVPGVPGVPGGSAAFDSLSRALAMSSQATEWLGTGAFARAPDASSSGAGVGWRAEAWASGRATLLWAQPVDLTAATSARMSFQSWLTAGATPPSSGLLQVSVDGVTWQTVSDVPRTDAWTPVDVDLGAYLGRVVYVRFVFDAVAPGDGVMPDIWRIDNVVVTIVGRVSNRPGSWPNGAPGLQTRGRRRVVSIARSLSARATFS